MSTTRSTRTSNHRLTFSCHRLTSTLLRSIPMNSWVDLLAIRKFHTYWTTCIRCFSNLCYLERPWNRIRSRVPIILHLHVRVFIWSNWTLGALLITRMMGELLIATHAQPLQNSSCSHCSLFPALRQDYSFYVSHCWSRLKTLGSRTQVRPDGWNSATAYIYHELSFHQLALHTLQVPVFTNHARESQFTKQGDVAYLRIWQIDH